MNSKEAMELAIRALKANRYEFVSPFGSPYSGEVQLQDLKSKAINALEESLKNNSDVVKQLVEALEFCRFSLEPYDDIKPRDWKTDRENLRRAHQQSKAALAAVKEAGL